MKVKLTSAPYGGLAQVLGKEIDAKVREQGKISIAGHDLIDAGADENCFIAENDYWFLEGSYICIKQ